MQGLGHSAFFGWVGPSIAAVPMAKQVTCDSCQRSFLVPEDIGDFWVLCPYCEMLNPQAQQDVQEAQARISQTRKPPSWAGWTFLSLFGVILFMVGLLGAIFGTVLVWLGVGFSKRFNSFELNLLPAVWLLASLACLAVGAFVLRTDAKGEWAKRGWKSVVVVFLAVMLVACSWMFVFIICSSP